ncbi:MAG: hypothetical protein ACTIIH_00830 [Brevibacterium sp.]|uniref:hypothetical protein n=1 Tax=Brevibacterium sp. TaxID=1701 RepID=UPI003F90226E
MASSRCLGSPGSDMLPDAGEQQLLDRAQLLEVPVVDINADGGAADSQRWRLLSPANEPPRQEDPPLLVVGTFVSTL